MSDHGAIVYLEIPADDIDTAAAFYSRVFGWQTRQHDNGSLAFDDSTGHVSGAWRTGRAAQADAGLVLYVKVTDVHAAVDLVREASGRIVQDVGGDPGELTARFRDPYGNLLALYQEPTQ